ncbi:MAG: hypothetical protein LBJ11_08680 [Oscillospiraceae bacterium]|jgi:hypothetical protein|nr:hypothetical protein [Oscillospiraceae bacterium]
MCVQKIAAIISISLAVALHLVVCIIDAWTGFAVVDIAAMLAIAALLIRFLVKEEHAPVFFTVAQLLSFVAVLKTAWLAAVAATFAAEVLKNTDVSLGMPASVWGPPVLAGLAFGFLNFARGRSKRLYQ